ncbi:MAG TPA: DUF2304 domain-containing protein [Caldilineae bacterium]|nr:DUF2304 domain-containing protein [Caldilineae bacterium]
MALRTRIFLVILGLAVLGIVINLVRTRRLQERFALLWLLAASGLVISPLIIDWLDQLAYALGFDYPPGLLLLLAVIGLLLILFQFSLNISRYHEQIKVLAQEVALLRHDLDKLSRRVQSAEGGDG